MSNIQSDITGLLINIPPKFLPGIFEYVKMINEKAMKGEISDTEYINKIPGLADSIVKEASKSANT